jgi:hypothetical protein
MLERGSIVSTLGVRATLKSESTSTSLPFAIPLGQLCALPNGKAASQHVCIRLDVRLFDQYKTHCVLESRSGRASWGLFSLFIGTFFVVASFEFFDLIFISKTSAADTAFALRQPAVWVVVDKPCAQW